MGIIVLMGGDEFRPDCEPMDRLLLSMVGRQPARVIILPTAAAAFERPDLAARHGVEYFGDLGAAASAVMVLSREDANNPALTFAVETADVVYLTGGNPSHLVATLRDSAAWRAIRVCHNQGGMIIGSSAGAMAMGGMMRTGTGSWVASLGLAGDLAVIPHHPDQPASNPATIRSSLSPDCVVLGIPTASGGWSDDGQVWHAIGARPLTLYWPANVRSCQPGTESL